MIIRRQLIRSATSIGANVVEAQEAASKKEFLQYINIALRSSRETGYWLELSETVGIIPKVDVRDLMNENISISNILAAILLKGRGIR